MFAKSTAPVRDRLLCLVHCLLSFAKRGKGEIWATLGLVILCHPCCLGSSVVYFSGSYLEQGGQAATAACTAGLFGAEAIVPGAL